MSSLATSVGLMSSIPMERVFSVPKAANMFERALGLLPFSSRTQGSHTRHAQADHAHVAIDGLEDFFLGDVGFHQGASVSEGGLVVASCLGWLFWRAANKARAGR